MSRIQIILSEHEVDLCRRIGESRQKRKKHLKSTKPWTSNTHVIGCCAEYAVCKYTGWQFNDVDYGLKGDKGIDIYYHNATIDVKCITYDPPILKFYPSLYDLKSDIVIAVLKKEINEYFICGFITAEEFDEISYIDNFGWGERACVNEDMLEDINLLPGLFNVKQ